MRARGNGVTKAIASGARSRRRRRPAPLALMQALWRVNHAIEQLSKRMELHLGVTAQQRMMVRWIGKHRRITPGQLAANLHLDAGTVSAAVRRMEDRDLVVRRRDASD